MNNDRYQRGWQKLMEVDGEGGQRVIDSLKDIAPDLGKYVVEFAFGDVYQREGLDLKQRQLITIAALTVGLSPGEIVESIFHCTPYTGFLRVLNATFVAKRIFEEHNIQTIST
ncbi:carboxymuconolactone decarboxylase family protein [Bacillus sp. FSL K6-1366]|uniref:carboxymuconolactone decarboxylase family protein n=1 Tax=Bacillus sp. FSL K6-1366 TaxID=2921470 RepID=UPI0030CFE49E